MTEQEQELREKIAKFLYDITYHAKYAEPSALRDDWVTLTIEQQEYFSKKADKILALIKKAGYEQPEITFKAIREWVEKHGYVKLAEDQSPPYNCLAPCSLYYKP